MTVKKIDLKAFEKRIHVRPLRMKDYDQVVALQLKCFPGMKAWTREQFGSMTTVFPEGQICIELKGRIIASSASLIVDFDLYSDWHDWRTVADQGFIRNHDPKGDTLYGIEIMVDPEFRGMRLSRRLYAARKEICRKMNVMRIVLGGRIPGYAKHKSEMTAREYVDKVVSKTMYDRVLTAQLSNGFALQRLIPEYMPSDEDSAGWATQLEWKNLDYVPDEKRQLNPVQMVRLCVVQYQMRAVKDFDEFARQCAFFIDVAAEYHSDFIVFPELFTTQLLSFTPAKRPGEAARLLATHTPRYLEFFTQMALQYNVNIIGGSQFVEEEDKLYNVSYLFRRNGTLGKQYKIHVTPSERRWWGVEGGESVEVFDTDRGRIAISVCYDIEFPELSRVAAKKGAQIIFCPFNTDERSGYLRIRYCAQARCIENHVYVATSGCVGNLPFVENADIHYAQSGIYTPADIPFSRDGIAAECMPNTETMVFHDVDLELLRRHRYAGTTQNWNDRRKDLYKIVYKGSGEELEV